MKYAVQYNRNFRHLKQVDEVILLYRGIGDNLVPFVEENFEQKQRIIVRIEEKEDELLDLLEKIIPSIQMLRHDNWNIAVATFAFKELADILKENEIPYFFVNHAKTIEDIYIFAEMGATDVYVVESLGFNMKDIKEVKDIYNLQIRVFPNIAQCGKGGNKIVPPLTKFWIRPEDTELYEEYVDVFEILGGIDNSRLSVIYEIYQQRQWLGDLGTLILDLNMEVPNTCVAPHFGQMRINCKKKCLTGKCNICERIESLAKAFNDAEIEIIKPRFKPERTEEEKERLLKVLERAKDGLENDEVPMPPGRETDT